MEIINLSSYKFIDLASEDLPTLRKALLTECEHLKLKGTILLAPEGINCFVAAPREEITAFQKYIRAFGAFSDMVFKESVSDHQPFTRMLVKIKKEIITMGEPDIQPARFTGKRVSAKEFKRWMDEQRDIVVLDTRNDYEVRLGTFRGAQDLNLKTFRQFSIKTKELSEDVRDKTMVTFCTGGIRCEKATALLMEHGFKDVYQLDGGILKYFEEVGGSHFDGECFVFDHRVAVDAGLSETETVLCYNCQNPVTASEQRMPSYIPDGSCPHCISGKFKHKELIAKQVEETKCAL